MFVARSALALLGLVGVAHADGDRPAAVALFDDAKRLMDAGRYPEACVKFAESNRLDPQLGALLHLADCYEKSGRLASAWAVFRDAAELADRRADARSLSARDRAESLEPKLSRLTVVVPKDVAVPGLVVRRDGVVLGSPLFGVAMPVDAGEHVLEADAPGKKTTRHRVFIHGNGDSATVTLPPLADEPRAAHATSTEITRPSTENARPGNVRQVLGWSAVAVGAAGIGAGVLFTVQRSNKLGDRDEVCPDRMDCTLADQLEVDRLTDDARKAGTIGVVGLAAGGAFVAGGLVLLLWPSSPTNPQGLVPEVWPGFAGLSMTGAF